MKFFSVNPACSRYNLRASSSVFTCAATLCVILAPARLAPARAAVLEQRWVAGQQLSYDLKLSDATLSLKTVGDAPVLWAGTPWDISLDGTGEVAFDTRAVDASGAGTLAVLVPRLKVSGSLMGMFSGVLDVKNGLANFSVNGRPYSAKPTPVQELTDPTMGMQISRLGRLERFVQLRPATPPKPGEKKLPLDLSALNQTVWLSALPQLWPARDVKIGEKWSMPARIPLPAAIVAPPKAPAKRGAKPGATKPMAAAPSAELAAPQMLTLGNIDMTLVKTETVEGRETQRVAVNGTLSLDGAKSNALLRRSAQQSAKQNLQSLKQTMIGDIWFDAAAGQIVKVVMKLNTQSSSGGTTKARDPKSKPSQWKSFQNFDGTVQLQLLKVSDKTAP